MGYNPGDTYRFVLNIPNHVAADITSTPVITVIDLNSLTAVVTAQAMTLISGTDVAYKYTWVIPSSPANNDYLAIVSYALNGVIYPLTQALVNSAAALTLTAASEAVGGNAIYTGTITGGASDALVGQVFAITGFLDPNNNGTYLCVHSTANVLILSNPDATSETHAGTATSSASNTTYFGTISEEFVEEGASNGLAGDTIVVSGFSNVGNNNSFTVLASSATAFGVLNASGVNETNPALGSTSNTTFSNQVLEKVHVGDTYVPGLVALDSTVAKDATVAKAATTLQASSYTSPNNSTVILAIQSAIAALPSQLASASDMATVLDQLDDVHDVSLGNWIIDRVANTLTLYTIGGMALQVFNLVNSDTLAERLRA